MSRITRAFVAALPFKKKIKKFHPASEWGGDSVIRGIGETEILSPFFISVFINKPYLSSVSRSGTKLKETTIKRTESEASNRAEGTGWCHCEGTLSWSSRKDLEKWGKERYTFPQQGQKGSSEDLQEAQLCFGSREHSGTSHL